MTDRRTTGQSGEAAAIAHLQGLGYQIITTNWRTRFGEIDVIAADGGILVFVEVRTRTSPDFGTAGESVDRRKQRKLVRMAEQYLQQHAPGAYARIDVVTIHGPTVEHLKGAVEAR